MSVNCVGGSAGVSGVRGLGCGAGAGAGAAGAGAAGAPGAGAGAALGAGAGAVGVGCVAAVRRTRVGLLVAPRVRCVLAITARSFTVPVVFGSFTAAR